MKGIPTLWKLRSERKITDTHVALYFWLRHLADEGRIVTSTKLQAADRDVTDRHMKRLLDDLETHGLIEITHNEKGKRQFVVEVTTGKENQKNFQENQKDNSESRTSETKNRTAYKKDRFPKKEKQNQKDNSESRTLESKRDEREKVPQREIKDLDEKVGHLDTLQMSDLMSDFSFDIPENVRLAREASLLGSEFSLRKENSSSGEEAAPLEGDAAPLSRVEGGTPNQKPDWDAVHAILGTFRRPKQW